MSQSPQPILTGALAKTPLAEFLIQAYDGGLEGTLLLQTAEREKSAVWFVRGAPAKARLFDPSITLRHVVVDLGLVSEENAASSQKQAEAEKRLHGAVLLERGYLDQTGLYVALREQLLRQTLRLCDLPVSTGFGFYRENFLEHWGHDGQWRVKPLRIVWRAVVDHLPDVRRAAWIGKVGDHPLRLRKEAPVSRYGMSKAEMSIVDMIRVRSGTVSDLIESGVGPASLVERVVCGLTLTRQLDLGFKHDPVGLHEPPETPQSVPPPETRAARRSTTAPRPSNLPGGFDLDSAPRSTPPRIHSSSSSGSGTADRSSSSPHPISDGAPPRGSITAPAQDVRLSEVPDSGPISPAIEAFAEEIEQYQAQPPKNYYEVLGIEKGSDAARVRSAFFQLAKKWHPDKLPPQLDHLRGVVNRAFAEMGDAHQTLMDEGKRAEYDRNLNEAKDDEQEQVASILRAASAYQRAEILHRKKSYKEALAEAKTAHDLDAQPDHVALHAWLHTLVHPEEDHKTQLEWMNSVIEANPDHVRTLWYRGQLYKKMQQPSKAMRDFKHILEIKPSHVDAAREVRVHKMRRQTDPKSGPGSTKPTGLFGFRKK